MRTRIPFLAKLGLSSAIAAHPAWPAAGHTAGPAALDAEQAATPARPRTSDQAIAEGVSLAVARTDSLIALIKERAGAGTLNRGLTIELPYFNEQKLSMESRKFEIIPAGRVMFVPAFVVLAARREGIRVSQDRRLDPSARAHLLNLLERFVQAFEIT